MPEVFVLLVGVVAALALVLAPLMRSGAQPEDPSDDARDTAALRHRVALEALRDVEADRRAGSLDDDAYATALAEAEVRAAGTRAELAAPQPIRARRSDPRGVRLAAVAAGAIGLSVVAGSLVPASGIANATVVNQSLADAQAAEAERGARIGELLEQLSADPSDTDTLSALADAYLEGTSQEDLVRAAVALRVLVELEPARADAYERIVAAYLRAGDYPNARAALDAYTEIDVADPVEVAFLDGLIALRGEDDPSAAVAAFDRFLELAPDDARAPMVRGLRDDAAGEGD